MGTLAHSDGARKHVAELATSLEAAANSVGHEPFEPDARKVSLPEMLHGKEHGPAVGWVQRTKHGSI